MSFVNTSKSGINLTWSQDTLTWSENTGTWDNPTFWSNTNKASTTFTNTVRPSMKRLGAFTVAELATDTFLTTLGDNTLANQTFDTLIGAQWSNKQKS